MYNHYIIKIGEICLSNSCLLTAVKNSKEIELCCMLLLISFVNVRKSCELPVSENSVQMMVDYYYSWQVMSINMHIMSLLYYWLTGVVKIFTIHPVLHDMHGVDYSCFYGWEKNHSFSHWAGNYSYIRMTHLAEIYHMFACS